MECTICSRCDGPCLVWGSLCFCFASLALISGTDLTAQFSSILSAFYVSIMWLYISSAARTHFETCLLAVHRVAHAELRFMCAGR